MPMLVYLLICKDEYTRYKAAELTIEPPAEQTEAI